VEYAQPDLYFRFQSESAISSTTSMGCLTDRCRATDQGELTAWRLQIAMEAGYDRAVYIEADALFAKPVEWASRR